MTKEYENICRDEVVEIVYGYLTRTDNNKELTKEMIRFTAEVLLAEIGD